MVGPARPGPEDAAAASAASTADAPDAGAESEEDGPPIPQYLAADASTAADAVVGDVSYGRGLRPGEGEAMAAYVAENKRVPRRGEVGWQGDAIEHLESVGYVMSGSRHKRMNAIRMRKENQVYTAEEKKALALMHFEERTAREAGIVEAFRQIVDAKMRGGAQ